MQKLTLDQIEYIHQDVRSRGIESNELFDEVVDHIITILEDKLENGSDFYNCYNSVIVEFHAKGLDDIQKEVNRATEWRYTIPEKVTIVSACVCVSLLAFGILFKVNHWPGGGVLPLAALVLCGLVFIPAFFLNSLRSQKRLNAKVQIISSAISAALLCLSFFLRLSNSPYALPTLHATGIFTVLVFLPAYSVSKWKVKKQRSKTIGVAAMIILGYCLTYILIRSPKSSRQFATDTTLEYITSEAILKREYLRWKTVATTSQQADWVRIGTLIYSKIEEIKKNILSQTGGRIGSPDFVLRYPYLAKTIVVQRELNTLSELLTAYNKSVPKREYQLPVSSFYFDTETPIGLHQLINTQLLVIMNACDGAKADTLLSDPLGTERKTSLPNE